MRMVLRRLCRARRRGLDVEATGALDDQALQLEQDGPHRRRLLISHQSIHGLRTSLLVLHFKIFYIKITILPKQQ